VIVAGSLWFPCVYAQDETVSVDEVDKKEKDLSQSFSKFIKVTS